MRVCVCARVCACVHVCECAHHPAALHASGIQGCVLDYYSQDFCVLRDARVLRLWNSSILDAATVWGGLFFLPAGSPRRSCSQGPLLRTCKEDQLTPGGRLLCGRLEGDAIKVVDFVREELLCFVLSEVILFYKFPSSQFPQTTKLQFAG